MRKTRCLWIVGLLVALLAMPALGENEGDQGMGGGGFMPGLLFLNLSDLNTVLEANGYAPFEEMIFVMGGGGFGGFIKGPRFGGMGWGGDTSSKLGTRKAQLSIGFGGFLIEQGLLSAERYSFSAGIVAGGGGADLKLLDHHSDSFETAISRPPNTALTRGFFAAEIYGAAEVSLLDWLTLKVYVGYLLTFGGPWEQDGNALPGPPKELGAPIVSFMITFGGKEEAEQPEES